MSKLNTGPSPAIARFETMLIGALAALVYLVVLWRYRLRSRHELSQLTPAQMHDVGLDPARVRHEAEKPFWQA